MSEKRPRISEDLAVEIDLARGKVPFEVFVRDALWEHLQLDHDGRGRRHDDPRRREPANDGEFMVNVLKSERFLFEFDRFDAAVGVAREYHRAEMDMQAREDEMEIS